MVNITDFTLSKFRYLISTKSRLLSLFSHSIVHVPSSCCTSFTSSIVSAFGYTYRLLSLVHISTFTAFLALHRPFLLYVPCHTIFEVFYKFLIIYIVHFAYYDMFCPSFFTESNSIIPLILSSISFCALCAFTPCTHIKTCITAHLTCPFQGC